LHFDFLFVLIVHTHVDNTAAMTMNDEAVVRIHTLYTIHYLVKMKLMTQLDTHSK